MRSPIRRTARVVERPLRRAADGRDARRREADAASAAWPAVAIAALAVAALAWAATPPVRAQLLAAACLLLCIGAVMRVRQRALHRARRAEPPAGGAPRTSAPER